MGSLEEFSLPLRLFLRGYPWTHPARQTTVIEAALSLLEHPGPGPVLADYQTET